MVMATLIGMGAVLVALASGRFFVTSMLARVRPASRLTVRVAFDVRALPHATFVSRRGSGFLDISHGWRRDALRFQPRAGYRWVEGQPNAGGDGCHDALEYFILMRRE